jgi:hypothetical protein
LFDGFDCSWRFVSLLAEPRLAPQWLPSIFGHFGWWHRIFCGEKRLSGVRGKRPSLRCWYWYLYARAFRMIYGENKKFIAKMKRVDLRRGWGWIGSYVIFCDFYNFLQWKMFIKF